MASNVNQSTPPDFEDVVRKIWEAVQHTDRLKAFLLMPPDKAEATGNKSPLHCEDHDLILQESCMKDLFLFVYPKLIQKTLDVEDQKAFLTTALLLNGNVKTFWNMRRELVSKKKLDFNTELRFLNVGLTRWRRCEDAINYRKWLLKDEVIGKPLDFLINELTVIDDICDEHDLEGSRIVWDYCIWLLSQCDSHPDFADFIHTAWVMSGQYMCTHVYDASHLSYRQRILNCIIHNRDRLKGNFLKLARKAATEEGIKGLKADDAYIIGMIVYEFNLNLSLMNFGLFGANFEGLWCYRRFLVWCWKDVISEFVSQHGDRRLQHAGGCVSDRFDAFDMYFHKKLQKKFLRSIKGSESFVEKYKAWIETFCPPTIDWEDDDNECSIS